MSKAFKWPKLPNSRPYLDRGYTSMQMREYAMKCIGEAIRNKQWVELNADEMESIYQLAKYMDELDPIHMLMMANDKLKEKNCGQ